MLCYKYISKSNGRQYQYIPYIYNNIFFLLAIVVLARVNTQKFYRQPGSAKGRHYQNRGL